MRITAKRIYAEPVRQSRCRSRTQEGLAPRCSLKRWGMHVRRYACRSILPGAASIPALIWLVTWAAAQTSNLSNVDLCNGRNRTSAEPQIIGCTALIKSDISNPHVLAIAYNNRGNAYNAEGKYELAIQDYDESIKLNPDYAKPFNNRGVAYRKKGDYDRAVADFDAAIKIDPNYADAFANRAEVYQKKGDYGGALKDFDEAIRLQPTSAAVLNERCWTRAIIGELQGALADCNEAIRLQPNLAVAFDSRGFTHLKLGQWELAIADYNSALRIDRRLPTALYGRGFAKLKRGDRAGADADIAAGKAGEQNIVEKFAGYGLQ